MRTAIISPAMPVICDARLHYFGHVDPAGSVEDHCRAIVPVRNGNILLAERAPPGCGLWRWTLLLRSTWPGGVLRAVSPGAAS